MNKEDISPIMVIKNRGRTRLCTIYLFGNTVDVYLSNNKVTHKYYLCDFEINMIQRCQINFTIV